MSSIPIPPSILGSATRTSFFDKLVSEIHGEVGGAISPDDIRDAVNKLLAFYFATGTVISAADLGSDFFDFSIGTSLAQVIYPMLRRAVLNPLDDVLRQAFRTDAPNPRIILAMLEDGVITPETFEAMLIDNDVKDAYLPLMRSYADKKGAKLIAAEADKAAKAQVDYWASQISPLAARAEAEVGQLENLLDVAEVDKIVFPLQRQLRLTEGQANQIDRVIDHALFDADPAATKAIDELVRILAQPLPTYPGTPQLPPDLGLAFKAPTPPGARIV